jgi:hypothetical protein
MQEMQVRGLPPPPPPPSYVHQQISREQQQFYYKQQLDENQRKYQELKRQHEQQLQRLKSMELYSRKQELTTDQQQQMERQRMWCQQLWNDQETVLGQYQELWHQFIMLGGVSEQQQLLKYGQQLVGIEEQVKQKYEQQRQQLKSIELNSRGQQLTPDQQQQLLGQSALCQQLEGDLKTAMKRRQEFQQKFRWGGESGLQTSYGHQQKAVLLRDGTWGVPEGPDQQQWVLVQHPPPQQPPQHVFGGADNTQWSGGGQQQEDEQQQFQLEQQRKHRENEQRQLAEQQRQHREEEQRLLAEQQQRERELALLDSQQKQLLAEQQKKIEEERIRLEQQKRLQQQQQEVDMETGDASQPIHDQRKHDEQQCTQPEKHREIKQQQPSHDQNQLPGDEYERSVREQAQAWKKKSQTEGTLQQQGEGKLEQHRPQQPSHDQSQHTGDGHQNSMKQEFEQGQLREGQIDIQIGDMQSGTHRQHEQQKAAEQPQSFKEQGGGSEPSHDQQQQPNREKLAEIQKVLKQQYKQELEMLNSMKLASSKQQLSHDQQQQLERQKSLCKQLLSKLHEVRKQEQELHGQLKLMLKAGGGKQSSYGHQSDDGKLGNRRQKHETARQHQRFEQQGGGIQPSHNQQEEDKEQRTLPEQHRGAKRQQGAEQKQHRPQEPIHGQSQQTGEESGRSVQQSIDTWQGISQTDDTQQQRKHQNQQESKQQQRIEQQHDRRGQSGDIVCCECGTAFYPNARLCPNPNCGKPRPRNQPQGPPCVHCGKHLIKEGAIWCGSCNKKQPAKVAEAGGITVPRPPPGLGHGYGYSNPPQQQQGAAVQPHSSAMVVASTSTFSHTATQSAKVFGNSAAVPTYAMTSGRIHQPTTSQFHSENKNLPANTGVPGALPSTQGNDGKAVVGPLPPGFPDTARPTKDHSADGKDSALVPCNTDPLRNEGTQSQANGSTKQEQTTPQDNNNNKKTTGGANSAGGTNSGSPESQSAGSGVAPDPPMTTDDPTTGKNNIGSPGEGATNSTSDNQKSYASVAGQKVLTDSYNTTLYLVREKEERELEMKEYS